MNTLPDAELLAVQQDASTGCVEWVTFTEEWDLRRIAFEGSVFVVDHHGAQLAELSWDAPTDQAADAALTSVGLQRTGDWNSDSYGRRVAHVLTGQVVPQPRQPVAAPASAASTTERTSA